MTSQRTKLLHKAIANDDSEELEALQQYLRIGNEQEPVAVRHLLQIKKANSSVASKDLVSVSDILQKFGSGAMSFGAISAESRHSIIKP